MHAHTATRLSHLDLALVALYLVAITIFGLSFSRRSNRQGKPATSLKSYFLADNTIPWWAIALSIVSAETSTLTIISVPGIAFGGDMGFLQLVLGYMVGRIVVALLFLPRYFRGQMLTAYQLIDQRFGPILHKVTAGLFLLTRAAAEGVRVFAISIVVSIAVGTGDTLSIAIITALTLLYTFEGGMAAVIWTDVVQMALYVAGTVIALFTLGTHIPGGWEHIYVVGQQSAKYQVFHFACNLTETYTFWAGLLGGTFLTMASHGTDQLMVQRMLAARNLRAARLALLSSGVVILFQFTLFLLIGVALFVFYSTRMEAFAPDRVFPFFIVREMPHGIAGLLIAAILAAAMSNLSAALNSLASTTVIDFYLPFRNKLVTEPQALGAPSFAGLTGKGGVSSEARPPSLNSPLNTQPDTTLISRLSTIFWALILFLIALYSIRNGGKGHVVETGLSIASVAYGSLLGVFLLGTLTSRSSKYGATQWGAILGMILGFTINLILWLHPTPIRLAAALTIPHIAYTWYVLIGALVTFFSGLIFSALLRRTRRPGLPATAAALSLLCLSCLSFRIEAQSAQSKDPAAPRPTTTARTVQPQPPDFTPDFQPVSTLITTAIAAGKLPGAVLLIGHKGKIVFHHAYGNRSLEPTIEPMTEDTIFDMASLTKVLVTTTAILQLYEQGKLDLDAPVAKYLHEFGANGKDKITIRQLLTHYSGLPEDVSLKDDWGLSKPDRAQGIRRALASVPYGPPATTFKYSDINFILLGALAEKITTPQWSLFADRPTLDLYAATAIFNPLGMRETRYLAFDKVCGMLPTIPIPWQSQYRALPGVDSSFEVDCDPRVSWTAPAYVARTAPTAHDDQGTAPTNPDFDHLLRGTVHDPTTRRMGGVAGPAGLFSTAADTSRFCQALLSKLLRNQGPFPLSQATLRLAISPQASPTAVRTATIFTADGQTTTGVAQRGLGWDLNTAFSRPRGQIFPLGLSFGHTGFTGTSIWIDPTSETYVILLANAVHPRGNPPISTLRGEVATAAAHALGLTPTSASGASPNLGHPERSPAFSRMQSKDPDAASQTSIVPPSPPANSSPQTQTGIDVLEQTHYAALAPYHHIGLVTNQSGVDRQGRRTIDLLAQNTHLDLIFTPEHGLSARQDTEHLQTETDPTTNLPVRSLYGPKASDKHPKPADLKKLDAVVIDLPDAGVRFWTYETVLGYFLQDCARAHLPVLVLDRPNPIGGIAPQGPPSDPGAESYIDFMPLPVRHSMTMGELARYFNENATLSGMYENPNDPEALRLGGGAGASATGSNIVPAATLPGLHAALTVIPMQNWTRAEYFADTGLPWIAPSPNMKTPATNIVYPAVALIETTNMSVGRGSPAPYENFGAPFLKPSELAAYLTARQIPGITFTASTLAIAEDSNHYPFHGQTIPAIHLAVTDRNALDTPELGIELLAALHHLYPTDFQLEKASTILRNAATLAALKANRDPREIAASWLSALRSFNSERTKYLLYP